MVQSSLSALYFQGEPSQGRHPLLDLQEGRLPHAMVHHQEVHRPRDIEALRREGVDMVDEEVQMTTTMHRARDIPDLRLHRDAGVDLIPILAHRPEHPHDEEVR